MNTADLSSISDSVVNNVYIKPKQLLFILNDINKKMEFLLLKTNDKLFEDEDEELLSESNVPGKISLNYFFIYLNLNSMNVHFKNLLNNHPRKRRVDLLFNFPHRFRDLRK